MKFTLNHSRVRPLLILVFLLAGKVLIAQNKITGKIKDFRGKAIENASIIASNAATNFSTYTYSDSTGRFLLEIEEEDNGWVVLEVNSMGYERKRDSIKLGSERTEYFIPFELNEKVENLREIVLQTHEKFTTRGDTTSIRVHSFSRGSEKSVEDLLKLLPGIEVLKDGSIKAHGRFINKLLIEGENLFDENYKVLSKNLDAKVLEEVEILDHFEDNPILAKFKDSEKIALNLKLKKEYKNIWFGNLGLGLGTDKKTEAEINLGLIRKKIKLFNFSNYNNLGGRALDQLETNRSSVNVKTIVNENRTEPDIAPIYSIDKINSILNEKQNVLNDAFFSSLAAVTKLNKKTTMRGTMFLARDNEDQLLKAHTTFLADEEEIIQQKTNSNTIKNSTAAGELQLMYNSGKKSYVENLIKLRFEPNNTENEIIFNGQGINQVLNQNDFVVQNHFEHSYYIGSRKLLYSYLFFGRERVDQDIDLQSPEINKLFGLGKNSFLNQTNSDILTTFGGRTSFYQKGGKLETQVEIGYEYSKINRKSELRSEQRNDSLKNFNNELNFFQSTLYFKPGLKLLLSEKANLSAEVSLENSTVKYENSTLSKWSFNPEVELNLEKMKLGQIRLGYRVENKIPSSQYFLGQFQLNTYYSFIKGAESLHILNNESINFYYHWNNEMKTRTISLRGKYKTGNGKYSTKKEITRNFVFSSYSFVNADDFISGSLNFTTYFPKLDFSSHLNVNKTWSNTFMKVNSENFKTLEIFSTAYALGGTTYFNFPINFNFEVQLIENRSLFNRRKSKNSWMTENLELNYKVSNSVNASLQTTLYQTQENNYNFINLNLSYHPLDSDFSYRLTWENVLNEDHFSATEIDGYSITYSEIKLIPAYLMGSVRYRF